jgi:hypothetical protein
MHIVIIDSTTYQIYKIASYYIGFYLEYTWLCLHYILQIIYELAARYKSLILSINQYS